MSEELNKRLDKAFKVPYDKKYSKTKQVFDVDRTNLMSNFATGKFVDKKDQRRRHKLEDKLEDAFE